MTRVTRLATMMALLTALSSAGLAEPGASTSSGADPNRAMSSAALPFVQLAPLISNDDYPPESMSDEEAGTVKFTITVGPDGRVSDCIVTSSSGFERLDKLTCRLIRQRARFGAARDGRGKPVARALRSRITWQL
jgi:protein TonB